MSGGRRRLANLLGPSGKNGGEEGPGTSPGPLLSIVLPIYNVEEYLAECLDSIAEQSFSDYELLVVDDGSPDGSRAIAERYAASDERIRIITRENGGLGAARNTGIREAAGEFLTFVDSDDMLPPGALEALVTTARADRADIVCGAVMRFAGARSWAPSWVEDVHTERRTSITAAEFLPLLRNLYTWNKVFRRDFWDECGLWFREGVAYEDQPIVTELFASARRIDVITDVVYLYRVRPDQSSISQQVGTIKDLRDRVAAWEATREVLLRDHPREIHDGWLQTLLDAHFHWYLNAPALVADDYWAELQAVITRFLADAPKALWDRALPTRRVLLELVRRDRRADAQTFVEAGGRTLDRWPATPRDGGLDVHLPFRDDPELDDDLFFLPPGLAQVDHRIDLLRWTEAGCVLSGWAYVRQVDLSEREQRVELLLTHSRTGEVRRIPAETGVPAVFPPAREDDHADYTSGTFRATLPLADLLNGAGAGDAWSVSVRVEVEGTAAEAPVRLLQRPGMLQAVGAGPGLRVSPDNGSEALGFRIEEVRLDLLEVGVSGRAVSMRLGGPALAKVTRLELGCEPLGLSVEAAPARDGRVTLELPSTVDEPGPVAWQLSAYRADGTRLRGNIPDAGWTDTVYADAGGAVELRRTRRNHLVVRDWSTGALADSAEVRGDELVVSGSAFGTIEALTLVVPSLNAGGPPATVENGRFEARLPLERDAWRFGRLPIPAGDHDVATRVEAPGRAPLVMPLAASDALVAAGPSAFETDVLQGRVGTRAAGSVLRLSVLRPLGADRPRRVQRALREMPARPLARGLLVPAGDDGLALVNELRRRSEPLPVWWAVPDRSWPVPDGVQPVVVASRAWHEVLASASHLVADGWRPVQHEQPTGQVVAQLGSGYPLGPIGLEAWRAEGVPQRQIQKRLEQAGRWDVVASPAPWATRTIRAAFEREWTIVDTGPLRSDLVLGDDADDVRARVRKSLGLADDETGVLVSAGDGVDLARLRTDLGPGFRLLARGPQPDTEVADVTHYPVPSELFLAADVAVLAGSQDGLDFAVTGKPMVRHLPEPAKPLPPGPVTGTLPELVEALHGIGSDPDAHRAAGAAFRAEFLPLADGRAAARLLDALDLEVV